MAELGYTSENLVKTRFVVSPLNVMSTSVKAVYNPTYYSAYSNWIHHAEEALQEVELPVLSDFNRGAVHCTTDLLAPFSFHAATSLEDELQQIATMSESFVEESIHFQLKHDPPDADILKYEKQPRILRDRAVEELQIYWDRVIQPHWTQMQTTLESDIIQRSRQIAAEGYEQMLMELDPRITIHSNKMSIDSSRLKVTFQLQEDEGIYLVPMLFTNKTRLNTHAEETTRIAFTYPAIGSGNWRDPRQEMLTDAMSVLLGEHRAELLFRLQRPMSTQELAQMLFVTSSAVSQQLKQLYEADLVKKHRMGKRVYYVLSERGQRLLAVFDQR